ncbi:MAG TPA: helix-turn-helix domain-containing protein [Candidatus Mediterraneibacter pullistercoris]|nr:helix-turn-helix domain-containing protein [Candidatus Mediterraneibacter pullistercoris]
MDNRIRELRHERGLRQEDLAGMLNVSQQTISRIENGENSLPADILKDLSRLFRVSADYILKLSDSRMTEEYRIEIEKNIGQKMDFIRAYSRLNRTNQELISRLMGQLQEQQHDR